MNTTKKILSTLFLLLLCLNELAALNPSIIFQGKITEANGIRVNGTLPVVFSIYNSASGGSALWTETHNSIAFENGIFSVELGNISLLNSLVFDKTYYLGINVNNGGELMPRSKINYSMYSIKALYSDTAATAFFLGANAVGTGNLTITDTFSVNNVFIVRKDGKVGINTLAPSEQLEIGGKVKASHFIGDGSQLSGIVSSGIIDASITSAHIKNGELANEDIADNANINPSKIDTALIRLGNNQMLANINAEKIGDGTISNSEFGYLDGVTSSIQNQLNSISMDTAGLLNRITNLESDSANTENRLSGLESDSANTENRISVIENLQTSMNDTFYNKGQVDNYIKLLSSDTHLLKNSISDYKTNVENETIHIYSLLNSLGTDTNSLKSDLTSYRFVVHADTLMIYNWLNSLSADTSALKSELSSFKIQVNNETASINSRVNNIHSEINDSFALKSNLNNPVFTGLITGDSLMINNSGFIVFKTGNVSIGDNSAAAKLEIKGSGSDSSTAALSIKNSSNSNLFYIDNSGNIGVGTTAPSARFEINGALKALNTGNRVYAVYAE